ncbi:MFS transporter [Pedobacter sp. HMF7647]|uniref:MFS transporter n=1 Tax=Hufsiella arboris TaxID=2695275 RepID=A0A7K1Y9Y5_9SPHI|nr:MFS transporter [Hufsiella arboris]MXV51230.1 MFS transporter [Hufsiella arboris]
MFTSTIQLYKTAYTGLSKNSWYLSIVMLINRSGTMVIPFMTIYCTQQLHYTITQAGTIMALFGLGSIAGAFIGGKITDKLGFYQLQVGALMSGGIMFIVIGLLTHFIALCIGTFVLSICNESFRPANSTAIAHYSTPENQTRSYALNRLAINLGWSFGGALGGFLASFNYHLLFWVDGCTNIFAAFLLLWLLPYKSIVAEKKSKNTQDGTSPYRDRIYLAFIGLVILFASCFFQLFTMEPVFFKTQWGFNERLIGMLMALNGIIIAFFEMIIIHKIDGKKHPLFYIVMGTLISGGAYILLNLLPVLPVSGVIVVTMITIGEILCLPFMNSFWISRSNAQNRGAYAALYTMAWSTAQILAPTLGSQVIYLKGFGLLWTIMAVVCLLSGGGFYMLYKTVKVRA